MFTPHPPMHTHTHTHTQSYTVKDDNTCTVSTNGGSVPHPMQLDNPKKDAKQEVIFSYGVRFEESDVAWASRWDTYVVCMS